MNATLAIRGGVTLIHSAGIIAMLLSLAACSKPSVKKQSRPPAAVVVPAKTATVAPKQPELRLEPTPTAVDPGEQKQGQTSRQAREQEAREAAVYAEADRLREVDLQALLQRAMQGDAHAQVDLGIILFEGKRVPQDWARARNWWAAAAQRGHPAAWENLRLLQLQNDSRDYRRVASKEPVALPRPPVRPIKKPAPRRVTFFGTPGKGRRFVFIIDKSSSMMFGRLESAKNELLRTLRELPAGSAFMIYFFNHQSEPMPVKRMMTATPGNIARAERWIRAHGAFGTTDPSQALKWAFELKPDTIWLLTDGQFQDAYSIIRQLLRDNRRKAVRVNTVGFYERHGEPTLRAIAGNHGGAYRFVAP